jgi:hypothetical protein
MKFGMCKRSADYQHTALSALGSPLNVRIGEQTLRRHRVEVLAKVIIMGLAAMK